METGRAEPIEETKSIDPARDVKSPPPPLRTPPDKPEWPEDRDNFDEFADVDDIRAAANVSSHETD